MFEKLDRMKLKGKLNFGYAVVIGIMVLSGLFSIIGLGVLYGNLHQYIYGAQSADTAVKICIIDVNIAARNIREMALNDDTGSYADYRSVINEELTDIGTELEILKNTGVLDEDLYLQYETVLTDWGEIGYKIMNEIEAGNQETAAQMILNECAPALDEVLAISSEIDQITDLAKEDAVKSSQHSAVISIAMIVIFIIGASLISTKLGKRIVNSITVPLSEVEKVAAELAAGNLHSNLEYHSEDEIGSLAHNLRKSIRSLGSYVDDIDQAMKEFSNGNFIVQPAVEWKGDFVGILNSFKEFEASMADTVKGIQAVADQVTNGADQVAASSMDLAQGATNQAATVEQLTTTTESVSEQVVQNAENAKKISQKVENVGVEIINSNGKMQEMVEAMSEISESSREISKIIATINDIASQTNLLALNASIEAARAGESGRGFAVVADQVSVLAAQSAEAAKESTVLIETSVRAVERGMVIARETAQQLENAVEGSKVITDEVNGVATVLEDQAVSIEKIQKGVVQINDVVQSISATSEECAAASQEMSSQASTLEGLIREFTVV